MLFNRVQYILAGALLLTAVLILPAAADAYTFSTWGSQGTGANQFKLPQGIAVGPDGSIYVCDTDNHRVQKFTSTGTYLTQWGGRGSGARQFEYPKGIAVDGAGSVYVADWGNDRIQKFDANGGLITQWGGKGVTGTGPLFFDGPFDLAISPDGYIYVTDNIRHRIVKFTLAGVHAASWDAYRFSVPGIGSTWVPSPSGIAIDGAGNVYVVEANTGIAHVVKYTSAGTVITHWGNGGATPSMFHFPVGVALDAQGSVYVCDSSHVHKFSPTGTPLAEIGSFGTALGQFKFSKSIDIDASGTIYMADYDNNRVHRMLPPAPITPPPTLPPAPVAGFSASPTAGTAPLTVQFTDTSTGGPTGWTWSFGDGATSTERNPAHAYPASGTYTVTLRASNAGGADDEVRANLVTVARPILTVPGGAARPTDTNGDTIRDDLNGNGRRDFADIVLYFNQMTWIEANEPINGFDCNINGRVDFADVVWLFNHL